MSTKPPLDKDNNCPFFKICVIQTKKGASLSEGTSPYTFHTHATPTPAKSTSAAAADGRGVEGRGEGKEKARAQDMAVYGQLIPWPQLK